MTDKKETKVETTKKLKNKTSLEKLKEMSAMFLSELNKTK